MKKFILLIGRMCYIIFIASLLIIAIGIFSMAMTSCTPKRTYANHTEEQKALSTDPYDVSVVISHFDGELAKIGIDPDFANAINAGDTIIIRTAWIGTNINKTFYGVYKGIIPKDKVIREEPLLLHEYHLVTVVAK